MTIKAGKVNAAMVLFINPQDSMLSDMTKVRMLARMQLPEANEQDQRKRVEAVKRWLNEQSAGS